MSSEPAHQGPRQLPLALPHRTALEREDFLVTAANGDAVAWIDRWPDWPTGTLILEGPPGAGKSHLASVWRARSKAVAIEGAALSADCVGLLSSHPCIVIEEADRAHEESLLHLYNLIRERRGFLLLTAQDAPARWGILLPDLRSRLTTIPRALIAAPDDLLIRAVMIKLFSDRQMVVGADVVDFIAKRIERSFATLRRVVAVLDDAALAERRRITVPFARAVLHDGMIAADSEADGV